MVTYTAKIRVRYADTDKMQFVYNGKYLEYFEVGRTELLRSLGLPYSQVEKEGYQLPLIEAGVKYKKPAHYDDLLLVKSTLKELFTPKVHIDYEIRREVNDDLICTGFTTHVFIKEDTKHPTKPPKIYIDKLSKYFDKN